MTPRETAAFNVGLAHAAEMARIAAISIEIRDDARQVRQQAAAAALHGLAEGLREAARAKVAETSEVHIRETS
ncbi:hypothetical protein [Methylobacterium thuringiense]|uniref:Uncharacterized protein n=1 Tax=Methylobacterium thuringiense TaxID=1003091 RepID=A0ABQ4TQV2_9HYPH|nr:hypothetical protein [Methylobacterium thuringiense]GJE57748.1 hypothetical protein EKPJFOCH_4266 [Methylobacterium thuringiense]